MTKNIEAAAEQIRQYHEEHATWPVLGSEFVEALPLTFDEIEEALSIRAIEVVTPPAGPYAYLRVPGR